MAEISEELKKFREAIYGKDVRNALISCIEKINEEVEGHAKTIETATQTANDAAGEANSAARTVEEAVGKVGTAVQSAENAARAANQAAANAKNEAEKATNAAGEANEATKTANSAYEKVEKALTEVGVGSSVMLWEGVAKFSEAASFAGTPVRFYLPEKYLHGESKKVLLGIEYIHCVDDEMYKSTTDLPHTGTGVIPVSLDLDDRDYTDGYIPKFYYNTASNTYIFASVYHDEAVLMNATIHVAVETNPMTPITGRLVCVYMPGTETYSDIRITGVSVFTPKMITA